MKLAILVPQLSTRLKAEGPLRLVRSAGVLTFLQVIGLAVGYLSQILYARWLGPREYGVYTYVIGWVALLAALPTLGLPEAVLRFIPEYLTSHDWARLRGVIRG